MPSTQTYDHLLCETTRGVYTITLNRPEVFNAINDKISLELQDAMRHAAQTEEIRAVILTGIGDKAFCSGADLKEAQSETIHETSFSALLYRRYNPLILAMRHLAKPIICRLNGIAAGAGCSLALACDIIIASEEASLSELFVSIGLVTDAGSSFFLPRLVGSARAFELCSTGRKVKAAEALEIGLINKVVPAQQLDEAVGQLAGYYAQAPTRAIGLMKDLLNRSYHSSLEQMLELEARCQDIAGNSQDHREGVGAFLEKRRAQFKGI